MPLRSSFGEALAAACAGVLRGLREQHGLSQAELARAMGLSQPSYSRLERRGGGLTVAQLWACASRLGVSPSGLAGAIEHEAARAGATQARYLGDLPLE
jgi:transcriptional regulator with XRE-family HTH domain